jgi:MFS family permease
VQSLFTARQFAFLRIPSYYVLLTDAFLLAIITHILLVWLPLFLHETFQMDLARAGLEATAPIQAGSIIGVLLGGALSDFVGRRRSRNRMLVQTVCALISAPLLLVFLIGEQPLAIYAALFSFAFIRYTGGANANPVICDLIPPERRSAAFGVMNLTNCLAAGAGVLVAGALKEAVGLRPIFACASAIGILAGFTLLTGYRLFLARDLERAAESAQNQ